MDTDALRWFQQVADGVRVTEVADLYLVSQPGVSRALARLEQEVGTPLLHKSGRVLRTTHAGSVFKRHVDALLHSLDDGLAAVTQLVDPETGTVAVAFQSSLGTWLVPDLIREFRQAHPLVQFRLEQSYDGRGSSLLAAGGVDVEVTARRSLDAGVQWRRLFNQPLVLAVPPGHPLADRMEVSLAEVAADPFVMLRLPWELRKLTDELCGAAGFAPRVAFEGDDLSMVRGFVATGLGVAVVPGLPGTAARRDAGGQPLLRLSDKGASRDVGLAWSRDRRLLPSAELFRQHVLTSTARTT